jgi:hypothetical protein
VACSTLAVIFVLGRIFSRVKLEAGLWLDDYLIIGALAAYICDSSTGLVVVGQGFGQHIWYLSPENLTKALQVRVPYMLHNTSISKLTLLIIKQFLWFSEWLYIIAITLTKLSLIFFFRRIFPGKGMRLGTLYFGSFVLLSNSACFFVAIFQCYPVHGNWTNWMYRTPPVKCLSTFTIVQVAAALGIFHDIVIMVMPLPTLWNLNLPLRKKINLFAMFMIGIVVITCSCLRIPSLIQPGDSTDYSCKYYSITPAT